MTPGDTLPQDNCVCCWFFLPRLPPPSRHLEPPFSIGEVGRLNPYHGEDFPLRFTGRPRMGAPDGGGVAPYAMVLWWSSS